MKFILASLGNKTLLWI